jgi:nucleotide sugar dehydrogenase
MRYSQSPVSGKRYQLPTENDKNGIDQFLSQNRRTRTVCIQGLGFVGAAMALVVANSKSNYRVIGVDLPIEASYWRIADFNSGLLPLVSSDQKMQQYFDTAQAVGSIYATHDVYAYKFADVIVIDINLDVQKVSSSDKSLKSFDVDLEPFELAMKTIFKNCKKDALILVETTVPPGTCEKIVWPIAKQIFKDRGLDTKELKISHSYERVTPGPNYIDSIENFYRVYAGTDCKSADAAESFLADIINTTEYPLQRLKNTTASETAKVLENSYRAMNIAFMQEWTEFAELSEIDLYEIIDAIRIRPTHKNIMRPGLGVGGYCLTKDPLLASWASQRLYNGAQLQQSETAVRINDQMPLHTVNVIQKHYDYILTGKKILLMGVSYLNDVGDTRFTPVELLYDQLISQGALVTLHDPYLSLWTEKQQPVERNIPIESFDMVVVSVAHSGFYSNKCIEKINQINPSILIDTMGVYLKHMDRFADSIDVRIIGKG